MQSMLLDCWMGVMHNIDSQIQAASNAVAHLLDGEAVQEMSSLLLRASERASADSEAIKSGKGTTRQLAPRAGENVATHSGPCMERAGSGHLRDEPDELGRSLDAKSLTSMHLQRELSFLIESADLDRFKRKLEVEDDRGARRFAELIDKGTYHGWLWTLVWWSLLIS